MKALYAGLAVVLLAAGFLVWKGHNDAGAPESSRAPVAAKPEAENVITPAGADSAGVIEAQPEQGGTGADPRSVPESVDDAPRPRADAVASMRRARIEGDPRTPPLAEHSPERAMPSEEELADPEMYLEYESRQKQKVITSFLESSEKKISELGSAIERAEAEGLPAEQLEEGREKLRRLEAMREQLLRDHPELAPSDTEQVPDSP